MSSPEYPSFTLTISQMTQWKNAILEAVQEAVGFGIAPTQGQKLSDALVAAEAAINGVLQSFGDAAQYINLPDNQKYTYAARAEQASQIVKTATDKAQQAIDSLSSVGAKLGDDLAASMQIDRPSGISDALVLDRKQDLQQVLQQSAGSQATLQQAIISRIQKAIDQGDSLSAYVLSAGPLEFWYESQGLSEAMVQYCYSLGVGSRKNPDGTPVRGAELAALLRSGGSGAFQDYLTCCKHILFQAQQDYERYLASFQMPSTTGRSGEDWLVGKYTSPASQAPTMRKETAAREFQTGGKGPLQF